MSEIRRDTVNCIKCGTETEKVHNITINPKFMGEEIIITGLTGRRCPKCKEQYVDSSSSKRAITIVKETKEWYKKGLIDGIRKYAWLRDGVQYVGTTGKTLKEAIEEIQNDNHVK